MRFKAVLVALAVAAPAGATDVPKEKTDVGGPAAGGAGPTGGVTVDQTGNLTNVINAQGGAQTRKWWEVGATLEEHALVRQNDLSGAGADRWITGIYGYARADVTTNNRISLRIGAYTHYVIDSGDSPIRNTDLSLS